jgi:hypothetical protein
MQWDYTRCKDKWCAQPWSRVAEIRRSNALMRLPVHSQRCDPILEELQGFGCPGDRS